jgi:hypothetical protein
MRKGTTLIEVVLAIGIMVMLFGGIYSAYIGILDALANSETRTAAAQILNREIEVVRNLPYDSVGVSGSFPAGVLTALKNVTSSINKTFTVQTTVRNIDDPFDGTLGGSPNDTAPADYKLVEFQASCDGCPHFIPLIITTTVSPKSLEGALTGGSLFLNVFDASAQPIQGATVHVVNASVTPAIDLTDITNTAGVLQLVGVPTSTQRYQVTVTKPGYSSDQTYMPGVAGNPSPVLPHGTVAAQTLTQMSFSIDRVSNVTVETWNNVCTPIGGGAFSLVGSKLIGTPSVLKFSTSSVTSATSGVKTYSNIEWDTYALSFTGSGYDVIGVTPITPFVINPSSSIEARLVLATSSTRSLLVTAKDAATGAGISGASVTLSNGGSYIQTLTTGRSYLRATDWSGGNYISQDGGVNTESIPGSATLAAPYSTSTTSWMISKTFDTGGSASSTYYALNWNPTSQPTGTTLKFQLASNNDNSTWNYIGPDGTSGTYYTTSGTAISSSHNGNRYIRYKAYFATTDASVTPTLDDVSIEFTGPCVPAYQTFFTGMANGAYTLSTSAVGYQTATSSITIVNGWQQSSVLLND